jgi:hypothetical protein
VFHTEEYGHEKKTYNSGIYVKGSTCSEFEADNYSKLENSVECNIIVSIIKYFHSNAIGMTPLIEESE